MSRSQRLPWVDYAKGFSILLVVHMHASLGVAKAMGESGWMVAVADYASTFRMPLFFMVAGLFMMRSVKLPWRDYIDRRVLHLCYFFLLWTAVTLVFKGGAAVGGDWAQLPAYAALSLLEPIGTLWFIYVLAMFYMVTRLLGSVAKPILWGFAAALHVIPLHTGWTVIDAFAANYVFFVTGYAFAPLMIESVRHYKRRPWVLLPIASLALFGNGMLFGLGIEDFPGVSLAAGLIMAYTIILLMGLAARYAPMPWLGYAGKYSIVIYLAFFIPMVVTREGLLALGVITDVDTVSLVVWLVAALSPLVVYILLKRTPLSFFFVRPSWVRLPLRRTSQLPAE